MLFRPSQFRHCVLLSFLISDHEHVLIGTGCQNHTYSLRHADTHVLHKTLVHANRLKAFTENSTSQGVESMEDSGETEQEADSPADTPQTEQTSNSQSDEIVSGVVNAAFR